MCTFILVQPVFVPWKHTQRNRSVSLALSQGLLLCLAFGLLYATYYHFEHVHFHVNRFYANLGYKEAQHNLAHSYMHGKSRHMIDRC